MAEKPKISKRQKNSLKTCGFNRFQLRSIITYTHMEYMWVEKTHRKSDRKTESNMKNDIQMLQMNTNSYVPTSLFWRFNTLKSIAIVQSHVNEIQMKSVACTILLSLFSLEICSHCILHCCLVPLFHLCLLLLFQSLLLLYFLLNSVSFFVVRFWWIWTMAKHDQHRKRGLKMTWIIWKFLSIFLKSFFLPYALWQLKVDHYSLNPIV